MKLQRTKLQEVTDQLFPNDQFLVLDDQVDRLVEHYKQVFQSMLDPEYLESVMKYMSGTDLENMDIQRKFHAMKNLAVYIGLHPEARPDFLPRKT